MRKLLILLLILLVTFTSVQLWVTQDRTTQKKELDLAPGQAETQLGGTFTLTDQSGKQFQDIDFRGKIMLVFFGFTHCPDICPVTVATLTKAMALLGEKADQVVPVFISVDPENDTPAVMKDFLSNFDKRIVGLTGNGDQIKQVAQAYKVYFSKKDSSAGMSSDTAKDTDSGFDHSAYIYMMGKDGKFIRVFPYNAQEQEIAGAVDHQLSQ